LADLDPQVANGALNLSVSQQLNDPISSSSSGDTELPRLYPHRVCVGGPQFDAFGEWLPAPGDAMY